MHLFCGELHQIAFTSKQNRMKISMLFLCLLTSILAPSQSLESRIEQVENGFIFPSITPTDQKMNRQNILVQLEKYKIHGASIAVVHKGKIDWVKPYGFADKNHTQPTTTQTLFQSASIGKIITSLVALRLVQEGKLNLDKNINAQLKRWKLKENDLTKKHPVTLRHLLSHTAGLTDDYGFLGYEPKSDIPTLLQLLNNESPAKTKKPWIVKTTPGEVERYSGGGYLILQLAIEDASGLSFEKCVQQYVFDPLRMKNTTYDHQPDQNLGKLVASGHRSNGKPLKKKSYHVYPEKAAAGPWTTAEDLAKLIIGIQQNSVLNSTLTQEMMTPFINHKGLGVNLKGVGKPHAFWHAGQNLGYTGLLYGSLRTGNGAVILLNSDGGERLMQEFISSVALTYNWNVMKSY
jgi:CubicO group peptidase (beta-lactamase class C family)